MGGYLDRPNLDIQVVRDFLKAQMAKQTPGSALCMGYMNALEKLDDLQRFKRDFHPALVRNDELIREARSELAVEVVNHYATKTLLERAERLIVEHRMRQEEVGDHAGGRGRDRQECQAVCHRPHRGEQQDGCRGAAHPVPVGSDPADEAGEGPRVPEGGA